MRAIFYAVLLLLTVFSLPVAAMDYRLGSGDIVHITVYDHPELLLETRVDEQGKINFPLIGGGDGSGADCQHRTTADSRSPGKRRLHQETAGKPDRQGISQ